MPHLIEIWETIGERGSSFTPSCLACGWVGGDGTRPEAEAEARLHERGGRMPWQVSPGQKPRWEGDPRSRPAD